MHLSLLAIFSTYLSAISLASPIAHDVQKPINVPNSASKFPPLLDISISEITSLFQEGSLTSVQLVKAYIARIKEVNDRLSAVSEINPDALEIAKSLDEERKAGHVRSPLHGIPILIKDNIATGDKMNNTAGSVCMLHHMPPRDSTVVSKLRAAGAIVLGKTSMAEWADARSGGFNGSVEGWSGYGGQVYGAYCKNQNPLGSSSGSGVAVSIGLALAALGTETMGSIIAPSAQNNIVGIKPTLGLTSRDLIIPITIRQDSVGPMARTVSDAAAILTVMAGKDSHDNYTLAQPFATPPDYTKALNLHALRGARIGVPRNGIVNMSWIPEDKLTMAAFEEAIAIMRAAGAIIVDPANFPAVNNSLFEPGSWVSLNRAKVFQGDFRAGIDNYLSKIKFDGPDDSQRMHTIEDVLNCTQSNPLEQWPLYDTKSIEEAVQSNLTAGSAEVWKAYQSDLYIGREGSVTGALDEFHLDALVMPSFFSIVMPALGGLPIVTVPMGVQPENAETTWDDRHVLIDSGPNVPIGLAFMGQAWSEETLVGLAFAYEQKTLVRRKVIPWIQPKTEL